MGGTRPADRPASAGRWGRDASTDHSHEDGEGAVDAVLFTAQDPRTVRHRRVPTTYGPATAPETAKHERPGYQLLNGGVCGRLEPRRYRRAAGRRGNHA